MDCNLYKYDVFFSFSSLVLFWQLIISLVVLSRGFLPSFVLCISKKKCIQMKRNKLN